MIIKGKRVGSIKHWGRYLPEAGENEKVTEHEIRGTIARDLKGVLEEMRDLSLGTRSEGNFLYHCSFNPKADEKLTPEQWQKAIDLAEQRLGLEGHQRIVYEHVKEGRQHYHVLWNRVDPETMTIRDMKNDHPKLRNVSNELEREFGLTPTKAVRDYDDPRPYEEWEKKQDGRKRLDREAMKAELTELWRTTDSGAAFLVAAGERGYSIAKGDRRSIVVLDRLGHVHSLARRLEGVKTAEVKARFQDVGEDKLFSVEEVRQIRRAEWIAEKRAEAPFTKIEERINAALERSHSVPSDFNQALKEEKITLARVTADDLVKLGNEAKQIEQENSLKFALEDAPKLGNAPNLKIDQVVAISSAGHIHKLNQYKLNLRDIAGRCEDGREAPLPGVVETRDQVKKERTERRAGREQKAFDRATSGSGYAAPSLAGRNEPGGGILSVFDAAANVAMGLADFIAGFAGSAPSKPMSRSEESLAERRSERALDNMKRSLDQGEPFRDHDVKGLTREVLLDIQKFGDPYIRDLLAKRDRERQRYLGNERER